MSLARSSWLRNEMTMRRYRMRDGSVCVVKNEYQRVTCPSCDQLQYCRLTHIWNYDAQNRCSPPEYHTNYNADLDALRSLLVTYSGEAPVTESFVNDKWVLLVGGQTIGEEVTS